MNELTANKPTVRPVVFCYGIFVSLMLFQTSFLRLGTITALAALVLIFLAFFVELSKKNCIHWSFEPMLLLIFALLCFGGAAIHPPMPSYALPMLAQMLVCIALYTIDLTPKEHRFLKQVFIWATVVYSVLIIYSCLVQGEDRYVHGQIILFNTELDPNYIGIPLVAAMTLLLSAIVHEKRKLLSVLCYGIVAVAMMFTSSRGNFLATVLASVIYVLFLIFNPKISQGKKILFTLILTVVAIGVFLIASRYLAEQWERMSEFGAGSDHGRFDLWKQSIDQWSKKPFLGHGLGGMFRIIGKASHNTYLQILSETGLVGLLLFVPFLLIQLGRAFRCDKDMFVVMVGMLFQILFLDALDSRCVWVVLIWVSMLPKRYSKEEENYLKQ